MRLGQHPGEGSPVSALGAGGSVCVCVCVCVCARARVRAHARLKVYQEAGKRASLREMGGLSGAVGTQLEFLPRWQGGQGSDQPSAATAV